MTKATWGDPGQMVPTFENGGVTAKHTPGPWLVVPKAGYPVVVARDDSDPTRVLASPGGYSIGEMRRDATKATEIMANARLIAAAPELLEALKDLIFYSRGLVDEKYIRDAQAVVAKAEAPR